MRPSNRACFNPIKSLTPESLSRMLDQFHAGHLRNASLMWDSIERRDDVLAGVVSKRKKAVTRLQWEILTVEDSQESQEHRKALEYFYNNLSVTHACDQNISGGFSLLVRQMMDAVAKKYAVHEIIYMPQNTNDGIHLTASFRFVPLWYFDNTEGRLRFMQNEYPSTSFLNLDPGAWLVSTGEGLMEASSIAYLFKHLPLRDWLVYCERNGMPGIKAVTDALPNTPEWEVAREAVENFSAEFHALMSRGCEIEAIDLTARGAIPYQALIERMDRAMISLWRGCDLSTLSSTHSTGVTIQQAETDLIEDDDARQISETLNNQVDRHVIQYLFKTEQPKAYLHIKARDRRDRVQDLSIYQTLFNMGLDLSKSDLREKFGIPQPNAVDELLYSKRRD